MSVVYIQLRDRSSAAYQRPGWTFEAIELRTIPRPRKIGLAEIGDGGSVRYLAHAHTGGAWSFTAGPPTPPGWVADSALAG